MRPLRLNIIRRCHFLLVLLLAVPAFLVSSRAQIKHRIEPGEVKELNVERLPDLNVPRSTHATGSGITVAYSVAHPTAYPDKTSDYFWQTEGEFTTAMWWSGAKTIYDPCPLGWKMPSKTEMSTVQSAVSLPGVGFIGWPLSTDFVYGNPSLCYYWTNTGDTRTNAYSIDNCTAS